MQQKFQCKKFASELFKKRSHTMKSLQSLQEKRYCCCNNVIEAFQCSVSYIMK